MTSAPKNKEKKYKKPPLPVHLELEKEGRFFSCVICGIMLVPVFSENEILLVTQGGRLRIFGEKLSLVTFGDRSCEVKGKIAGVEMLYGKN